MGKAFTALEIALVIGALYLGYKVVTGIGGAVGSLGNIGSGLAALDPFPSLLAPPNFYPTATLGSDGWLHSTQINQAISPGDAVVTQSGGLTIAGSGG